MIGHLFVLVNASVFSLVIGGGSILVMVGVWFIFQ